MRIRWNACHKDKSEIFTSSGSCYLSRTRVTSRQIDRWGWSPPRSSTFSSLTWIFHAVSLTTIRHSRCWSSNSWRYLHPSFYGFVPIWETLQDITRKLKRREYSSTSFRDCRWYLSWTILLITERLNIRFIKIEKYCQRNVSSQKKSLTFS